MRIAAYQAPLLASGSMDALERIQRRVAWCEAEAVGILCCPEAILGGLADAAAAQPMRFAIDAGSGQLESVLAPLASNTVTTIVGFTEIAGGDRLYNSAAVLCHGIVAGVYRKQHPAINRSVYEPGRQSPVFEVDGLILGIVICNDSNFAAPARAMAAQGATALFVPTNNGLPAGRARTDLRGETRRVDVARAVENRMWVIRADVAGRCEGLESHGSSAITNPDGLVVQCARAREEDLIVAEIDLS